MSTSLVRLNRKTARRYFRLFLFTLVFSAVYESLSHHVISLWMVCLPLFPLLLGVLPFRALERRIPDGWARQLWHCGVATGMMGSCLTGVFEIAGTYMPYTLHFLLAGALLLILAVALYMRSSRSAFAPARRKSGRAQTKQRPAP